MRLPKWMPRLVSGRKAALIGTASALSSGGYAMSAMPPAEAAAYLATYGQSGWVYICARTIAMKTASAKMHLYDPSGMEIERHVLLDVLASPNEAMSGNRLRHLTQLHLDHAGEAFWYVVFNNAGGPEQIIPLNPALVAVVPGKQRLIDGYILDNGKEQVSFDPEEIVHFAYPNPDPRNPLHGASPLSAIRYAIATNQNAQEWNHKFFKNGARPDGYLSTDLELDEVDSEALRKRWERNHQGNENWRKIAVASHGLKYLETGLSHADMDFLDQLVDSRNFILAVLGVPRSIVGIVEDVNRANAFQDELNFATYTIDPRLELQADTLNSFLLPRFSPGCTVGFTSTKPQDEEFEHTKRMEELDHGVTYINEVREEQGKEPVPWGDEPYQRTPGIFLNSQATARFLSALTERPQGSNVVDVPAAPKKRALPPAPVVLASPRTRAAIALVKSNMPAEHERYSRRLSKREARMKKKLAKLWRDVEREMVARMREALVGNGSRAYYELHPQGAAATLMLRSKSVADEFVFDIATVSADLGKLWKEHDVETALDEAAVVARQFAFDNVLPEESVMLQNWAGTRAERFSFAVTQQAADDLRQTLNDGTLASETLDELVERVSGVFENKQGYEAERIARTESATASSMGRLMEYKESGVCTGKEWLTAIDERTRESHAEIDGQVVGLDEMFTLGSGVQTEGPGLSGEAEEDINCRCEALPVVGEPGEEV